MAASMNAYDERLADAKRRGRDRVVSADELLEVSL